MIFMRKYIWHLRDFCPFFGNKCLEMSFSTPSGDKVDFDKYFLFLFEISLSAKKTTFC